MTSHPFTKRNKFHAKRTEFNGRIYDSKKEANYAAQLELLKRGKVITEYICQPRYDIIINDINCGFYKADFLITFADGHTEVWDVKGMKSGSAYAMFRIKKKIVEALYQITIIEK